MELIYDANLEKIHREIKIKKAMEKRTRLERILIILYHNYDLNENIIDLIYTEYMNTFNKEYKRYFFC